MPKDFTTEKYVVACLYFLLTRPTVFLFGVFERPPHRQTVGRALYHYLVQLTSVVVWFALWWHRVFENVLKNVLRRPHTIISNNIINNISGEVNVLKNNEEKEVLLLVIVKVMVPHTIFSSNNNNNKVNEIVL